MSLSYTGRCGANGGGVFFVLFLFYFSCSLSLSLYVTCGKTFERHYNLWAFKLLRALLCNTNSSACTRLVMVRIRMHPTSEQEEKCAPFIRYSFAHGVAQPLLQRGEEEQGRKDYFKSSGLDRPHHGQ